MKFLVLVLSSLTLVACGGGGGGGTPAALTGPVSSTLSFPMRSGLNALAANGSSMSFTANGSATAPATDGQCSGTMTQTVAPATAGATFEGAPALSAVSIGSGSLSNCTPAVIASTTTGYYDSNYLPLGSSTQGGLYGVYEVPPVIPNSATVGTLGNIGTLTLYAGSTNRVVQGRTDVSFVIEPDTATTAIINLISRRYDASSPAQLLSIEQDKYRMSSTGALTPILVDIQYATTSTIHVVFR
jgi:hypothetical protein